MHDVVCGKPEQVQVHAQSFIHKYFIHSFIHDFQKVNLRPQDMVSHNSGTVSQITRSSLARHHLGQAACLIVKWYNVHTSADSVVQLRILISILARTIERANCVVTELTAPRNAFTALINICKVKEHQHSAGLTTGFHAVIQLVQCITLPSQLA